MRSTGMPLQTSQPSTKSTKSSQPEESDDDHEEDLSRQGHALGTEVPQARSARADLRRLRLSEIPSCLRDRSCRAEEVRRRNRTSLPELPPRAERRGEGSLLRADLRQPKDGDHRSVSRRRGGHPEDGRQHTRGVRRLADGASQARASLRAGGTDMSLPSPTEIFVRAYTEKPGEAPLAAKIGSRRNDKPSPWSLTFDCETTVDAAQALRIGAYQVRYDGELRDEGLFYEPTGLADDEMETIQRFAAVNQLTLLTADEFRTEVFLQVGYHRSGLIIGFNLPFDISRRGGSVFLNRFLAFPKWFS